MNKNHTDPVQFEFFSGHTKNQDKAKNSLSVFKCLTLTFENIIVLCIIFVISLVLSYSLGVESGRKIARVTQNFSSEEQNLAKIRQEILPEVRKDALPVSSEEVIHIETDIEVPADAAPLEKKNLIAEEGDQNYFTIQVASFKLEKNAKTEASKLRDTGYETFVVPKGEYSIVCVGKFAERKEAEKYSGKLKSKYNDFLIRRL